jgi:hypothetical protein
MKKSKKQFVIFSIFILMIINYHSFGQNYSCASSKPTCNWQSLGPINFPGNLSTTTTGTGIGRIITLCSHPTDLNILYASGESGGLWKTVNKGVSWTSMNTDQLDRISVSAIAVAAVSGSPDIVYIATGNDGSNIYNTGAGPGVSGTCTGIYKTTNNGVSWTRTGFAPGLDLSMGRGNQTRVTRLIIHPTNPNILLAGVNSYQEWGTLDSYGSIFKTSDAGATWTLTLGAGAANPAPAFSGITSTFISDIEFKPSDPTTIYAAGHRLFKSTNTGSSWTDISNALPSFAPALPLSTFNRILLAVSSGNPNYVYAFGIGFCTFPCASSGLWVSNNSFASATKCAATNLLSSAIELGVGLSGFGVSATDPNKIYISGLTLAMTNDGGNSFFAVSNYGQKFHADVQVLEVRSNDEVYVATDGGVWRSNDVLASGAASTWTMSSNGLAVTECYRIAVSLTDDKVMAVTQDNFAMVYSAGAWKKVYSSGDGTSCLIDPANSNKMFFTDAYNKQFYRTTDGGVTIASSGYDFPAGSGNIVELAMDPSNSQKLYLGKHDLFKSTDQGTTWTKISNFTASNASRSISGIAVTPLNTNMVVVAFHEADAPIGWGGGGYLTNSLYKTTDGINWTDISPRTPGIVNGISSVTLDPKNVNIIYITYDGIQDNYNNNENVYRSVDGGTTWSNYSTGLPQSFTRSFAIDAQNPGGVMYVGTDVGMYYRDITTSSWQCFDNNLPNVPIYDIKIDYPEKAIYIGTWGRGVWKSGLASCVPVVPTIAGPTFYCGTPPNQTFNVPVGNTPGATYTWSMTSGLGTFVGSNIGQTCTVDFNNSIINGGGTLTLTVSNACGSAVASVNLNIASSMPATPNAPSGPTTVCNNGATSSYSLGPPAADIKIWDVFPLSAVNTMTVTMYGGLTVDWNDSYVGDVTLKGKLQNGCGTTAFSLGTVVHVSGACRLGTSDPEPSPAGELDVQLYPNPTDNDVDLIIENSSSDKVTVEVVDIKGASVFKREDVPTGSIFNFGSELPTGTYLVKISDGQKQKVVKFTKQ